MPPKMNMAQLYFEMPDVIIVTIGKNEEVTQINKIGAKTLGYAKEEIVGKNWFSNFIPTRIRETLRTNFHKMLKGTIPLEHYENPILTKEGSERIIAWHNILVKEKNNIVGTLSSGADVTELRLAEKARRESEERFRTTVENMIEGYQVIDPSWHYVYINNAAAKQGRHTKEELIGKTITEMYPGIADTEMFSHLRECMTKRIPHQLETEFTFPDGLRGWFELRIEPAPEGILILSTDITKRKEMEKELKGYRQRLEEVVAERTAECAQANKKLMEEIEEHHKTEEGMMLRATILDNAREAIFLVNSKGDFVYANQAASKTYGYSHEELLNMNLRQLLRPQEKQMMENRLKEAIEKGKKDLETIHVRKDNSQFRVKVRHSRIKTKHGQFIVSVMGEIGEKPKNQQS